jgi:DNA-binding NarL/FixJ family response regulator
VIGSTEPIRILIADDHPSMREGLRATLERQKDMEVVAEADDGAAAVTLFRQHHPHLTLMDLQMPTLDGFGAIASIRAEDPEAVIVALTSYAGDARVARALSAGATSYVLKTSRSKDIVTALRRTLCGEKILDDPIAQDLAAYADHDRLTPREISVLQLVAGGYKNRDIGQRLNVSEEAVKARAKSIFSKLNARDRAHAVTIARQRGFIDC